MSLPHDNNKVQRNSLIEFCRTSLTGTLPLGVASAQDYTEEYDEVFVNPQQSLDKNRNKKLQKPNSNSNIMSRGQAATMTSNYVTASPPQHRQITGCISSANHKCLTMDDIIDLSHLGENDLLLLMVQGRFHHDDLKLFDESWILNGSSSDSIGSKNVQSSANASIMQTAIAVMEDVPQDGVAEVPEGEKHTESNVRNNDMFVLSNLVQETFKKMSRRRQSAPSAVLRNVLRSSKLGSRRSIETTSGLLGLNNKDEARVECLPFSAKPSFDSQFFIGDCNRQYVREGRVQLTVGMHTQERYMFLFSDVMMLSKIKSGANHKLKNRVRLNEVWLSEDCIIDVVGDVSKATANCSFVIGWPTTNVVATFSSPEIKQLWFNDLNRLIALARGSETLKYSTIRVTGRTSNAKTSVIKSINVNNENTVHDFVETAVVAFQLDGSMDNYQLWVSTGKDPASYPLIGHERPHSIRMNCVRDSICAFHGHSSDNIDFNILRNVSNELLSPRFECNFLLLRRKCSPLKLQYERSQRRLSRRKSKTPIFSFNWGRKRSVDIPRSGYSRHNSSEALSSGDSSSIQSPTSSSQTESPKLFGIPLNVVCEEGQIPTPIMSMLNILYRKARTTTGIFRKSANVKNVKLTKENLRRDCEFDFSDTQIHVVAALLKDFLRSIPDSLLQCELHTKWVEAMAIENIDERTQSLISVINSLDDMNRNLVTYLIFVLNHISTNHKENNMTAFNLAVCVSPSLLWSPIESDINMQTEFSKKVAELVEFMIDNFDKLFDASSCDVFTNLPTESEVPEEPTTKEEEMSGSETTASGFEESDSEKEKMKFDRSNSSRIQIRKRLFMNTEITASMDSLDHDIIEAQLLIRQASRDLEVSLSKLGSQTEKLKPKSSSRYDVCSLSNDSGFTTLSGDDEEATKLNKFSFDKANLDLAMANNNKTSHENIGSDESLDKIRERRSSEPPLHYNYSLSTKAQSQIIQETSELEDQSCSQVQTCDAMVIRKQSPDDPLRFIGVLNSNCSNNVNSVTPKNTSDSSTENRLAQEYLRKLRESSTADCLDDQATTDTILTMSNKGSCSTSEEDKPSRTARRRSSKRRSRNSIEKRGSLNESRKMKTTPVKMSSDDVQARNTFSGMHEIQSNLKNGKSNFSSSLPIHISEMRETRLADENKLRTSCENILTNSFESSDRGSAFTRRFRTSNGLRSTSLDCFDRSVSLREKNNMAKVNYLYDGRGSLCEKHRKKSAPSNTIPVHETSQQNNVLRKNSMPASFVNLDSLLEKMNQNIEWRNNTKPKMTPQDNFKATRARMRKENAITRPGALKAIPLHQTLAENVNFFGTEASLNENNDVRARRSSKLNDVDLFNLSESLAFGNRKTPRNLTPVTTPVLKRAVSVDVEASRKKESKRSSPSIRNRYSTKNNSQTPENKHDLRQFKFYGFKELANAEESYV